MDFSDTFGNSRENKTMRSLSLELPLMRNLFAACYRTLAITACGAM
jgi:hypothetical protein